MEIQEIILAPCVFLGVLTAQVGLCVEIALVVILNQETSAQIIFVVQTV